MVSQATFILVVAMTSYAEKVAVLEKLDHVLDAPASGVAQKVNDCLSSVHSGDCLVAH
jgi:hypothetical protein